MKHFIHIVFILFTCSIQAQDSIAVIDTNKLHQQFEAAYLELEDMLEGRQSLDFKRAVFVSENAFYEGKLNYTSYCETITDLTNHLYDLMNVNGWDSTQTHMKHTALFNFMTREYTFGMKKHIPFEYNFEDFEGRDNWESMTTTHLLNEWKGNCYVMPLLAKILANEMNAKSELAIAPQHLFLKAKGEGRQWYNMEFTNRTTPFDDAYLAEGFININAVRNGIYLVGLNPKQEICLPLLHLAQAYKEKLGLIAYPFMRRCIDLAMKHSPIVRVGNKEISSNVNALLLLAETQHDIIEKTVKDKGFEKFDDFTIDYFTQIKTYRENVFKQGMTAAEMMEAYPIEKHLEKVFGTYIGDMYVEMQQTYLHIALVGYEEMPIEKYKQWLKEIEQQAIKRNQEILYFSDEEK